MKIELNLNKRFNFHLKKGNIFRVNIHYVIMLMKQKKLKTSIAQHLNINCVKFTLKLIKFHVYI